MHEAELHRQIAELVADHTEHAVPPPVAAIRRRGRRRRGHQASAAVLLIVAVAAGLVAPKVTQPPRSALSFAADVQAHLDARFVDMTFVELDRGTASGYVWQLAAVRGTPRHSHGSKVCLVRRLDVPGRSYGIACLGENSSRELASLTFGGGLKKMPLWGLAPQGAARVRLLGPKGTTPIEVPAKDLGPGFERSYYLAPWKPNIHTVVAFDGQGHEIARYPPRS